jgi:hypothetical protein
VTFTAKTRRRWFGVVCLLAAILMLTVGETTPGERFNGVAFVVYWLACFVFAVLAMLVGILDARASRREARAQQRVLLEGALAGVQADAKARPALTSIRQPPEGNAPDRG